MSKELKREISLLQATSINMIDMVGIGPFVTIPLVIGKLESHFLYAWILGAIISGIDAFIWSELGSAFPRAGGSYNFLKEEYGPKWGKLLSFLFVWQTIVQAPLVVASGAIGFAQYATYLYPFNEPARKIISGGLVIVLIALLYREIKSVGRISVVLWVSVVLVLIWMIIAGFTFSTPAEGWLQSSIAFPDMSAMFFVALGSASVKTIYSYLGYYNVCHLGGEIRNPAVNIPRSIFISVACISMLYLLLNLSIVRVIPWNEARHSTFIASDVIGRAFGHEAGMLATALVLLIAFASLFAVLLGYSRIPYAAAIDGQFFPAFGKLHPTKNFPHISLLALGALAFAFSLLFRLSDVITAVLAMRIVVQFIGQSAGIIILRRRTSGTHLKYRMPLFPVPALLAIAVWSYIFISTGKTFMISGCLMLASGLVVFFIKQQVSARKNSPVT